MERGNRGRGWTNIFCHTKPALNPRRRCRARTAAPRENRLFRCPYGNNTSSGGPGAKDFCLALTRAAVPLENDPNGTAALLGLAERRSRKSYAGHAVAWSHDPRSHDPRRRSEPERPRRERRMRHVQTPRVVFRRSSLLLVAKGKSNGGWVNVTAVSRTDRGGRAGHSAPSGGDHGSARRTPRTRTRLGGAIPRQTSRRRSAVHLSQAIARFNGSPTAYPVRRPLTATDCPTGRAR
jgi:hypothetical protein